LGTGVAVPDAAAAAIAGCRKIKKVRTNNPDDFLRDDVFTLYLALFAMTFYKITFFLLPQPLPAEPLWRAVPLPMPFPD